MKYLVLFILFVLVSCSSNNGQKNAIEEKGINDFKTFKIDVDKPAIDLVSFIDEVEIMRLEETESSLLSMVVVVESIDDRILIPHGEGDFLFFSTTGDYQSTFNQQGPGPEEYERFGSVWADANGIGVFDDTDILLYGFDGRFLSSSRPLSRVNSVYPTTNGYAFDASKRLTNDSLQFNVILVDKDLKTQAMLNPFKDFLPFNIRMSINAFRPYENGLLYHQALSDTVFLLKDQNIRPLLNIDFGDRWIWNDESLKGNQQKAMRAIGERQTDIYALGPHISKDFILFNSRNISDYVLIDRATSDYRRLKVTKENGRDFQVRLIKWEEDRFLVSLSPDELTDFTNNLESPQIKFRQGTTLEEIESSENPVLIWIKFKDFNE